MSSTITKLRARFVFPGDDKGELGFQKGDVIVLLGSGSRDGYLKGKLRDKVGEFPATYAEPMQRVEVIEDFSEKIDDKSLIVKKGIFNCLFS